MSEFKPGVFEELKRRGFVFQASADFKEPERALTVYAGYDATAQSLHVGNLVTLMLLRTFLRFGHHVIVLLGSATTLIGDPSGKDATRPMLSGAEIDKNAAGVRASIQRVLGNGAFTFENNILWHGEQSFLAFLGEAGHLSVNRMLALESVKQRIDREEPLNVREFLYSLMQAQDFVELSKRYGVSLQVGGSDQWGNILMGVELGKRSDMELFGLTCPLITTADGAKMGKTESGAVWLNPELLAPFDYYQFWRNVADADVPRFLRLFTEVPLESLEENANADINLSKKVLAFEATKLCHGEKAAEEARKGAENAFEGGGGSEGLPVFELSGDALGGDGVPVHRLVATVGLAESYSAAKRLVEGDGVRVNGKKIGIGFLVTLDTFDARGELRLSVGRRQMLVRIKDAVKWMATIWCATIGTGDDEWWMRVYPLKSPMSSLQGAQQSFAWTAGGYTSAAPNGSGSCASEEEAKRDAELWVRTLRQRQQLDFERSRE